MIRRTELTKKSLVGHNILMLKMFEDDDKIITKIVADGEKITPYEVYLALKRLCNAMLDEIMENMEDDIEL